MTDSTIRCLVGERLTIWTGSSWRSRVLVADLDVADALIVQDALLSVNDFRQADIELLGKRGATNRLELTLPNRQFGAIWKPHISPQAIKSPMLLIILMSRIQLSQYI